MHIIIRGDYIKYIKVLIVVIILLSSTLLLKYSAKYKDKKEYILYNLEYKKINEDNNIKIYKEIFNNDEIIGKIKINNTLIDSLVVKHSDNEYYLKHNINNKKNRYGSIFMDYRNNINDKKIIIYGHNFKKENIMFKDLEKYVNKEYFSKNEEIQLILDNKKNIYKVFSVFIIKKESGEYNYLKLNFKTDEEYLDNLIYLKKMSLFNKDIKLTKTSEILVLQTCYYELKNSFLVVVARKEN